MRGTNVGALPTDRISNKWFIWGQGLLWLRLPEGHTKDPQNFLYKVVKEEHQPLLSTAGGSLKDYPSSGLPQAACEPESEAQLHSKNRRTGMWALQSSW